MGFGRGRHHIRKTNRISRYALYPVIPMLPSDDFCISSKPNYSAMKTQHLIPLNSRGSKTISSPTYKIVIHPPFLHPLSPPNPPALLLSQPQLPPHSHAIYLGWENGEEGGLGEGVRGRIRVSIRMRWGSIGVGLRWVHKGRMGMGRLSL